MEIKGAATYQEQIQLLKNRGCIITDTEKCKQILKRINYFRLTAYFLPFQETKQAYRQGTSFEQIYRIYEFDSRMRRLVLFALEDIELFLRTQIGYYFAHQYGPEEYLNPKNFMAQYSLKKWKDEISRVLAQHNMKLNSTKQERLLPIWALLEWFSFGTLSHFYADMKPIDRRKIANTIGITEKQLLSWFRCCTDLRNICAHFGRLYYRKFPAVPAAPKGSKAPLGNSLFDQWIMLKNFYPGKEGWNGMILPELSALLEEYQKDMDIEHIGFPENWEACLKNTE